MALKVKELLQLQSLQGFKLVSGDKGLDKAVCSAGIADYEFAPDVNYHNDNAFDKDSFVISSLLFAQNDSSRILDAVRNLYELGISAFAYKSVIYNELPAEVLAFSNENNLPIFSFGPELYFENIIYEIMEAVQRDDTQILAEANIKKMIENELPEEEVLRISKSISLLFKKNAMAIYLKPFAMGTKLDMSRIFRNFYLNKSLKNKAMLCKYNKGLFIILTSAYEEDEKFELILNEAMESLSINEKKVYIARGNIYHPYEELDRCLREAYHTFAASVTDCRDYGHFNNIGSFKYLIPLKDSYALNEFTESILLPILDKEEYLNTVITLVINNGDITSTALECNCHQNTIRYRLSKVRELIGAGKKTEFEFYAELSTAVRIYLLKKRAAL